MVKGVREVEEVLEAKAGGSYTTERLRVFSQLVPTSLWVSFLHVAEGMAAQKSRITQREGLSF